MYSKSCAVLRPIVTSLWRIVPVAEKTSHDQIKLLYGVMMVDLSPTLTLGNSRRQQVHLSVTNDDTAGWHLVNGELRVPWVIEHAGSFADCFDVDRLLLRMRVAYHAWW